MNYQRADFAPLRATGYGVGFHWTTWTMPRTGQPLPFPEAVERFDADAFVAQAVATGTGHVVFPVNHALHWIPGPNPEVDRILPGRTCRRDLLLEIADGLAKAGLRLMLYYHHGTDTASNDDPEWQAATDSNNADQTGFYEKYCRVVGWMSAHYGRKVLGYWFDVGNALTRRGSPPWARMTAAAKAGNPDRLICYNPGVNHLEALTPFQDYTAGELNALDFVPDGPLSPGGLPWYSFVSWHPGEWGIHAGNRDKLMPPPKVEAALAFLRHFQAVGGTVTFNLLCYQDGSAAAADLAVMRELKSFVREGRTPVKKRNLVPRLETALVSFL